MGMLVINQAALPQLNLDIDGVLSAWEESGSGSAFAFEVEDEANDMCGPVQPLLSSMTWPAALLARSNAISPQQFQARSQLVASPPPFEQILDTSRDPKPSSCQPPQWPPHFSTSPFPPQERPDASGSIVVPPQSARSSSLRHALTAPAATSALAASCSSQLEAPVSWSPVAHSCIELTTAAKPADSCHAPGAQASLVSSCHLLADTPHRRASMAAPLPRDPTCHHHEMQLLAGCHLPASSAGLKRKASCVSLASQAMDLAKVPACTGAATGHPGYATPAFPALPLLRGSSLDLQAGEAADGPVQRSREEALARYRIKKANRLYTKKIRYQLRKVNADKRPRVKGRFVKKCDPQPGESAMSNPSERGSTASGAAGTMTHCNAMDFTNLDPISVADMGMHDDDAGLYFQDSMGEDSEDLGLSSVSGDLTLDQLGDISHSCGRTELYSL